MTKSRYFGLLIFVAVGLVHCVHKETATNGTASLKAKKLPKGVTALKDYREVRLPNGLRILFLPEQSLPSLSFNLLFPAGSASDPNGLSGLSNVVSELLDQGTKKRDAQAIADDLANLGAQFSSSVAPDYTTVGVSGLSLKSEALLEQFYEILTEARFPDDEILRVKKRVIASIQRSLDSPGVVADQAAMQWLYGKHPYGQPIQGRAKTIQELTKKHIIQHYLRFYRPNHAILAIAGRFDSAFEQRIEQQFGQWTQREAPPRIPVALEAQPGLRIRVVEKPGLSQAQIRFMAYGIERKNEDFLALRMANTVFGGAFASRLMESIRKPGYTYSIHSGFDARWERGPFEIETFTKAESVGLVVREVLAQYQKFVSKGLSNDELKQIRSYLQGIFPQAIETSEKLAFNLSLLRFYGIDDRYLTHYLADLDGISAGDVNAAIQRNLDPKGLALVIHGPPGCADSLKELAAVFETVTVDALK